MKEQVMKKRLWDCVLKSSVRTGLFMIVSNKDNKNMTISGIHKCYCEFSEKEFDYKNTYKHLKILEENGFIAIDTKKGKHEQGSPSIVTFKNKESSETFYQFLEFIKPDFEKWLSKMSDDDIDKITRRRTK